MMQPMKPLLLALLFTAELAMGDAARDARWQQDLQYLATQLPQSQPDFYSLVPASQFNQAVSDLSNAIPNISDAVVEVGLANLVAMPGVAHTALYLTQVNSSFHLLPLSMAWFDDGLFVTAAAPPYTQARGAKVVQIGALATGDAYTAVSAIISHENDAWVRWFSPNYLNNADILQAMQISPSNTSVHFVFQGLAGTQFAMDIAAIDPGVAFPALTAYGSAGFVPFYQQNRSQNYWYSYVESSGLLYFAYNVCEDMSGLPFSQFNSQFWSFFDSHPVQRLVIDLRNNGGGNSAVINPFITSLMQRGQRLSGMPVYAMIGPATFSSGVMAAISMEQYGVQLAGKPTGSNPNGYGNVSYLTLPNSHLAVSYATHYFSFPQLPAGPLMPNVSVPLASADYFARHDAFLAAALAGAPSTNGPTPTAAGGVTVVNAATYRADLPVAPGSLAAAFGNFTGAVSADTAGLPLATSLGGVQLLVNGIPAPLVAVRPSQIDFQVPANTASFLADIQVVGGGRTLATGTVWIQRWSPGLFIANLLDTSRPIAAVDQNSAPIGTAGVSAGSIIQIFGTGQGAGSSAIADGTAGAVQTLAQPQIFFGTEQAEVVYSGYPGIFPGMWQANVRVPVSAAVSGQVPLFVAIGGAASNGVTVQVNQ
jgi:uncharacterized protein (TIGR03437 family)